MTLYERLAIEDIRAAAKVLRPVFDGDRGVDGYVSLEVSPYLAMSTRARCRGRGACGGVGRENVMIKVPAPAPGCRAIRQLIGEGINVNITLLFSQIGLDNLFMDILREQQLILTLMPPRLAWRIAGSPALVAGP